MYEKHETEQYFFDGPTLDHLARLGAMTIDTSPPAA
jgi:hypothetical protein